MSWTNDELSYINQEGRVVFTDKYHLLRGYCCGNGCLHCPYDYKNVPEPRKSKLLHERKQKGEKPKH